MKTTVRITGMVLALLLAGGLSANAQRGQMRWHGGNDSLRVRAMNQKADSIHFRGGRFAPAPMGKGMYAYHGFEGHGNFRGYGMAPGRPGMGVPYGYNFREPRPGFRQDDFYRGQRGFGPGPGILESIPDLTEKQKKDIDVLREKQRQEMTKLREETAAKAKTLQESHHKKILELLNDDQKKYLEQQKPPVR